MNKRIPLYIQIVVLILFALSFSACQALEPAQEVQAESAEEAAAEEAAAEEAAAEEAAAEEAAAEEAAAEKAAAEEAAAEEAAAEEAAAEEAAAEEAAAEKAAAEEAAAEETAAEEAASVEEAEEPQLATAKASAMLTNQAGRAIVSARGNHFIVDSVPPIEGPNEELNPLDMMLGALATCGIFVAEHVAIEQAIPLEDVSVAVEGDLDASGVAGSGADPRIQAMRVHLDLPGADADQTSTIVDNFTTRCPIYTTLSRATDIEITVGDESPSAATEGLNTAALTAQLSNQPGRAIVSARGNHFVIDSVPPLDGPNEERNPLDLMLGALATCGTFIFESSAQEMDIPITGITTFVEADFDPRGVASQADQINPRLQAFRVNIEAEGIDDAQGAAMNEQFQQRCPIYTTLQQAAPIEVSVTTS